MTHINRSQIALALSIVFLLALTACTRKEEAPAATQQPETTQQAPTAEEPGSSQDPAESPAETASRPTPTGEAIPSAQGESTAEESPKTAQPVPAGGTRPAQPAPVKQPSKDPNVFTVRFDTTKGPIDIEVHSDWAPIGAARFRELVESGYYDGARFFRVVPGFVVQFGIAANPLITAKWEESEIKDDPVLQSNTRGMLSFATAGPNTRTTQMFINLADNQRLDGMGFAPIGRVARGMDVVDAIDSRYGESPRQPLIEDEGEAYLEREFPYLDKIRTARVIN